MLNLMTSSDINNLASVPAMVHATLHYCAVAVIVVAVAWPAWRFARAWWLAGHA